VISAALVAGRWHTSRLLLGLGHIGEAKVCHALMLGLDLLKGLAGAGKAAVRSRGLDSAAFSTVVQGSPGRTGRHGELCGRNWRGSRIGCNEQTTGTSGAFQGTFRASRDPRDPLFPTGATHRSSQSQLQNSKIPEDEAVIDLKDQGLADFTDPVGFRYSSILCPVLETCCYHRKNGWYITEPYLLG
jgi:hypothetical protein